MIEPFICVSNSAEEGGEETSYTYEDPVTAESEEGGEEGEHEEGEGMQFEFPQPLAPKLYAPK